MEEERLRYLIKRYEQDACSKEESEELSEWFRSVQMGSRSIHDWLAESGSEEVFAAESFARFSDKLPRTATTHTWKLTIGIAASLLIICTAGLLFFKQRSKASAEYTRTRIVKPGNYATITLADGSMITLNDEAKGKLGNSGSTDIIQDKDGVVKYEGKNTSAAESKLVYNTLTTPRGGKYALVLSDGTEVTMDAASSITYPVTFSGKERVVEVKGQAYFKVIHNDKQPFIVKAKGQRLRDIGTEFNVNAYDDEPTIQATLVEGRISISNANNSKLLSPGQQAIVKNGNLAIEIKHPAMDDVLAWTRGSFSFHHQQITDILRQAARWYDVEIVYKGTKPSKTFGGTLNRDKDVSELLESMKIIGGIRYKIEGRRVIIMN